MESENNLETRKRSLSQCSSDSSVSSEDNTGHSSEYSRSKLHKRPRRVSNLQFEFLTQQVTFLTQLITQSHQSNVNAHNVPQTLTTAAENVNTSLGFNSLQPPSPIVPTQPITN